MKTDKEIIDSGLVWDIQPMPGVGMSGLVKLPDCKTCTVIWTNGKGAEPDHVSVAPVHKFYVPSWLDMCFLKDTFFNESEECYQVHPKGKEYVNIVENCLHLWKPADGKLLNNIVQEIESIRYNPEAIGCGLEDQCITDRYEAAAYGWNEAMNRVAEIIDAHREGKEDESMEGGRP